MIGQNVQVIQKCKALINDPQPKYEQIYKLLFIIRKRLCSQNYQQQIGYFMDSFFHVDLHRFTQNLAQKIYSKMHQIGMLDVVLLEECLWIFTNLSLDETGRTQSLIDLGIVQTSLLTLKLTKFQNILYNSLMLIRNLLAQVSITIRLKILTSQQMKHFFAHYYLIQIFNSSPTTNETVSSVIYNGFHNISKLLNGPNKEGLKQQLVGFYVPVIGYLLAHYKDNDLIKLLLSVLKFMTYDWDYKYEQIDNIIKQRFQNSPQQIKRQIVEIYGNMASQTQYGVKVLLQNLPVLSYILSTLKIHNPNKKQQRFMKNCGWVLSNILAGTEEQIDYLLNNYSTFFIQIYQILQANFKFQILKQIIWAICNMIQSCSMNAFQALFSSNILSSVAKKVIFLLHNNPDQKLSQVFLEGVQCFIIKNNIYPEKFGLYLEQKKLMIQALNDSRKNLTAEHMNIRAFNAISYLQSIVVTAQISNMQIQ